MIRFKHAFVILLTVGYFFLSRSYMSIGRMENPWKFVFKIIYKLLIYDWLCIKQYHMSLPYDYIVSLSDVTKFCSLRNVYVLNPSPSTLVTKVSCPQQCVSSI